MLKLENIDLVVFDMAGTVVDEGGVVYQTLDRILRHEGASYSAEYFNHWHGPTRWRWCGIFCKGAKRQRRKWRGSMAGFSRN